MEFLYGTDLFLFNAGGVQCVGTTMGGIQDSLLAAGCSPNDISRLPCLRICTLTMFADSLIVTKQQCCRMPRIHFKGRIWAGEAASVGCLI